VSRPDELSEGLTRSLRGVIERAADDIGCEASDVSLRLDASRWDWVASMGSTEGRGASPQLAAEALADAVRDRLVRLGYEPRMTPPMCASCDGLGYRRHNEVCTQCIVIEYPKHGDGPVDTEGG
jgi:hypothetical protein